MKDIDKVMARAKALIEDQAVAPYVILEQDGVDGHALRLLQVALVETGDTMPWYAVTWDPTDIPGSPFRVFAGGADDATDDPKWGGWGTTVAKAADKCREALMK